MFSPDDDGWVNEDGEGIPDPSEMKADELPEEEPHLPDPETHFDEIFDIDYLPALAARLWTIFQNQKDSYKRKKQGGICTNALLDNLKARWFDYRNSAHKRNQFIQKLEMEVLHYKTRKLNPEFLVFFASCKSAVRDFINDLRAESGITELLLLKPAVTSYKSFAEIFHDESIVEPCLNLLKVVKKPVVNEEMVYQLGPRKKVAVVAWVDVVLKDKIERVPRQIMAMLLNEKIKGLNMGKDGRTLENKDNLTNLVYLEYQRNFNRLIA